MIIFLMIVGIIMGYVAVAGIIQPLFNNYQSAICTNCATGEKYELRRRGQYTGEPGDGHEEATIMAIFWIFLAPYVLTNMLTNEKYKTGRAAVKGYHQRKREAIETKRFAELEQKALGPFN